MRYGPPSGSSHLRRDPRDSASPPGPEAVRTRWLRVAGYTHRGVVRDSNQDAAGAGGWMLADGAVATLGLSLTRPRCCCVADGAGGHPAGDRASAIAVAALMRRCREVVELHELERAIVDVHLELHEAMAREPELHGMGTTIAALVFTAENVLVANVGDTRAYTVDRGQLIPLTVDDRPALPAWAPEDAQTSTLTQLLGGDEASTVPSPHGERIRLEPGLLFLLCTDGVGACLDEHVLEDLLDESGNGEAAVRRIVEESLRAGAPDNVTAMMALIAPGTGGT